MEEHYPPPLPIVPLFFQQQQDQSIHNLHHHNRYCTVGIKEEANGPHSFPRFHLVSCHSGHVYLVDAKAVVAHTTRTVAVGIHSWIGPKKEHESLGVVSDVVVVVVGTVLCRCLCRCRYRKISSVIGTVDESVSRDQECRFRCLSRRRRCESSLLYLQIQQQHRVAIAIAMAIANVILSGCYFLWMSVPYMFHLSRIDSMIFLYGGYYYS